MASSTSAGAHVGPAGNRELVFCHACEYEWYRDGTDSLTCPSCDGTFTEIIDAANDPRGMHGLYPPSPPSEMSSGSLHRGRRSGGSESDPDEDDIEEQLHGRPGGFFMTRSPFDPPPLARGNPRPNPNEGDAILRRFADMLMNDLGGARAARGSPGLFPHEEHVHPPGTRIHQTTFRTGPLGGTHTRVTITSGTIAGGPEAAPLNFGTLFGQLMGDPLAPGAADAHRRDRGGPDPGLGFGGLHGLLASLFNPAEAVHGDAVFTQEALDRIITRLMDASPQTNAAPPASQAAIDSLEKKRVDDQLLGGEAKAECTICIDEINKGDEVVVLPCKHWYHGECVVLWLKEHNTCPICRMPIESRAEGGNNNEASRQQSGQAQQQAQPAAASASASASASALASTFSPFSSFNPLSTRSPHRPARSARENLERLTAIRNLAAGESRPSDSQRPGPQRRSSHSPPGAWPTSESGSSSSLRSPSSNTERDRERRERDRDRVGWEHQGDYIVWRGSQAGGAGRERERERENREQQQQQQQGSSGSTGGPLGWFRDHFGRGAWGGSDRDRTR